MFQWNMRFFAALSGLQIKKRDGHRWRVATSLTFFCDFITAREGACGYAFGHACLYVCVCVCLFVQFVL